MNESYPPDLEHISAAKQSSQPINPVQHRIPKEDEDLSKELFTCFTGVLWNYSSLYWIHMGWKNILTCPPHNSVLTNSGNLLRQMVAWFNRNLIKPDSNFIIAIKNCFKSSSATFRNLSIIRLINNNIPIFFLDTYSLQRILWRKRSLWHWIQISSPVLSSHHKMQALPYLDPSRYDLLQQTSWPWFPKSKHSATSQWTFWIIRGEREREREREEEEIWKTKELKANPSNLIKYSKWQKI